MYVCMYVCMYVWYVCMHVGMYLVTLNTTLHFLQKMGSPKQTDDEDFVT